MYLRLAVLIALGLALAGAEGAPAHAHGGWATERYCPPWRDCGRCGCTPRRDCGGGLCYYGPADLAPWWAWRAQAHSAPEKHRWRQFLDDQRPTPPAPSRRPETPSAQPEIADVDPEQNPPDDEPQPEDEAARPSDETGLQQRAEVPERYQQAANTVGHTLSAIQSGGQLYRDHCASCHGAAGEGDGPRAQASSTAIAPLPYALDQGYSTDAYLLWVIMEGGEPFGTDKPGFAEILTTEQAWQIVAYMRADFPALSRARPLRQSMQTQEGNTSAATR